MSKQVQVLRQAVGPALRGCGGEGGGCPAAGEIVENRVGVPARAAVQLAVIERDGVGVVMEFDEAFDRWPGVERAWRGDAGGRNGYGRVRRTNRASAESR